MKSDDTARGNRNFLTGLGIAPWTLRLFAQLKIAKAGQLDCFPRFECDSHFLEKALDHIFGFAFVKAELLEQEIGEFGFS